MRGHLPRYVLGAAGGLTLIGSAVAGLHLLNADASSTTASIIGSLPADCRTEAGTTACGRLDPPAGSGTPPQRPPLAFRDGVYVATGHYETPGGSESLEVTLTLRSDTVSTSSVRVEATSPTARQFQDQFASRYAAQVVAKDIADVAVSRVAGASLTSVGFDRAIAEIRTHAHV